MIRVTFKYGINEIRTEVESGTTVQDVIDEGSVGSNLRLPESYNTLVNGVAADLNRTLVANDVVTFERAAAQKAS